MGKSYAVFYDRAYAYCRKVSREQNQEFDLCPNEAAVLFLMLSIPGVNTAKAISEYLGMAPALVSRVLDGLVRKEYVQTRRDVKDRRLYRISFCEKRGKDLDALCRMCNEFKARLTAGLTQEEVDTFFRVLDQMKANCREEI